MGCLFNSFQQGQERSQRDKEEREKEGKTSRERFKNILTNQRKDKKERERRA